jgi:hypothetical protein
MHYSVTHPWHHLVQKYFITERNSILFLFTAWMSFWIFESLNYILFLKILVQFVIWTEHMRWNMTTNKSCEQYFKINSLFGYFKCKGTAGFFHKRSLAFNLKICLTEKLKLLKNFIQNIVNALTWQLLNWEPFKVFFPLNMCILYNLICM